MDDPGSWHLLVAAICVCLTTYLSVAHLALRHAAWVKLEEAFDEQGRPERTEILRQRLSHFISTCATLRLLTNLILLITVIYHFTQAPAPESSRIGSYVTAFLVSALILMVFSVAVPHAWAQYAGTSLLVKSYPVLRVLELLFRPINVVLHLTDPIIRRLAGIASEDQVGSLEDRQEELLNVVEEGEKAGVVDEQEAEMIASVLELRDSTAGEIMTPRTDVIGIEVGTELSEAVEIVIRQGHSRYPVYEESIDQIIGMLYAKDLLKDLNHPDPAGGIRHRLRDPYYVPESKSLRDLLRDLQNQKVHLAVVLDEYGGTAGVVTIEDIVEELFGEITDEYEAPHEEPIKRIDEHTVEIDARNHVDEMNEELDLNIPEDDAYETVGGFAFAQLGCIPRNGDTFTYENLHFTIIDAETRKINRLRIVITPKEDKANNTNGRKNKHNHHDASEEVEQHHD